MKKFFNYTLLIILPGLLVWQCEVNKNPITYPLYISEEQKATIYRIVLDSLVLWEQTEQMVFTDSTEYFYLSPEILPQIPNLDLATLMDFTQQNQYSTPFRIIPDLGVEQILLSRKEFQNILIQGGWELFRQRYPHANGLIGVSNIGMNEALDQALVYFSQQWDYLAGHGILVFLTKDREWQITQILTVWIS